MNFLMTGGTGFIGRALVAALLEQDHQVWVLTRDLKTARKLLGEEVELLQSLDKIAPDAEFDWVINLAGAGIADRLWTQKRKQVLRDSRIELTQQLVDCLNGLDRPPPYMISASAVGYYGDRQGAECDENSDPGDHFAAQLCVDWESAALGFAQSALDRQVYIMRMGVVLDISGGLLQRLLPAFKCGLGVVFGAGEQWFPWIHRLDVVSSCLFLIKNKPKQCVYNVVAPGFVSQKAFAETISAGVKRPLWLRCPKKVLQFFLQEQATLFLDHTKVMPTALHAEGFEYQCAQLADVLGFIYL